MLKEVVVIVWVEERLDSIWTLWYSNGNVLCGIRKNCEQQPFASGNQSSFLRLLQMVFKRKFERCWKKSSTLFEYKNVLIPFELWSVAMETYFAESAKNCEQQPFAPGNQSSFLRLLQMEFQRKF